MLTNLWKLPVIIVFFLIMAGSLSLTVVQFWYVHTKLVLLFFEGANIPALELVVLFLLLLCALLMNIFVVWAGVYLKDELKGA